MTNKKKPAEEITPQMVIDSKKKSSEEIEKDKLRDKVQDRISEIVDMYEKIMNEGKSMCRSHFSDTEYDIDNDYITVGGYIEYSDGDIGNYENFSIPIAFLNTKNQKVIEEYLRERINQYHLLEKIVDIEDNILQNTLLITKFYTGINNLKDPKWIDKKISKLDEEIKIIQQNNLKNVDEITKIRSKLKSEFRFQNPPKIEKEDGVMIGYFEDSNRYRLGSIFSNDDK